MRRDLLALATELVVDGGNQELVCAGCSFQVAFMEILDGVEEADEEEADEEAADEDAASPSAESACKCARRESQHVSRAHLPFPPVIQESMF